MIFELLQYGFITRGLIAGLIIAIVAPLIGIFLVLRRYSLIADTLAHVSLAGVAIGLLIGIHPLITATGTSLVASLAIDKLRTAKKISGDAALALFLSGSLAFALLLISLAKKLNANLFTYLFGSITTVKSTDVGLVVVLGLVVFAIVIFFYKELIFIAFDEETARVNGLPVGFINSLFIMVTAVTVSISIPIIGVLLISALMIIPTVTALQLKKNFTQTIIYAKVFSVFSVVSGLFTSYILNVPTGAMIVLISLTILGSVFMVKSS